MTRNLARTRYSRAMVCTRYDLGVVCNVQSKGGRTMTRKAELERARSQAPVLAALLDELEAREATVVDVKTAWDELITVTDDRRMGAKEAALALNVQGPNLYATLRGPAAQRAFGGAVEAADELAMGDTYRARQIERLAKELRAANGGGNHRKRKQHVAAQPAAPPTE